MKITLAMIVAMFSFVSPDSTISWNATQSDNIVEVTIVTAKLAEDYCIASAAIVTEVEGNEIRWPLKSCPIRKSEKPTTERYELPRAPSRFRAKRMEGEIVFCGSLAEGPDAGPGKIDCAPQIECDVSRGFSRDPQ